MSVVSAVRFKSVPDMWKKEESGIKPNTMRKIDAGDERFAKLRSGVRVIIMENTETGGVFARLITDVSEWDGYMIISWNAELRLEK